MFTRLMPFFSYQYTLNLFTLQTFRFKYVSFVKVIAIQKLQDEKEKGEKKAEERGEEIPKLEIVRRYFKRPLQGLFLFNCVFADLDFFSFF